MDFVAHLAEITAGFLLAIYGVAGAAYALILVVRGIDALWLKMRGGPRSARR